MIKKELNFPVVYNNGTNIGYGGNQEWFAGSWQRKAGCASTSGANLAAYYASNFPEMKHLYQGDTNPFTMEEYLHSMEEMYTYMTPGPRGFPYVKSYAKQFTKFCNERGISLEPIIMESINSTQEAYEFVKRSINNNFPVALLILHHRAKELKEDNWHWVTITGYEEDESLIGHSNLILSNCGMRQVVKTNILFEVHPKNTVRMVSFFKKEE